MRDKLSPWLPAIFCATLALIAVIASVTGEFRTGKGTTGPGDMTFYCFMPMCFYFVGAYLSQLKKENQDLRRRIDEQTSNTSIDSSAA